MKKLLLSILALSVVVPFVAGAHTLLDGNGNPIAHIEQDNGNPADVIQVWGLSGRNTPTKPCNIAGIETICSDLSALNKPVKAEPTTEDLLKQLEVLKKALLALLASLR